MYQRILICNDMIYSRTMLKNIVDQCGEFIIVEVENSKEAISKIIENKSKGREFEMIFLDLEMKREDGLNILKDIRRIEPLVEVIVCGGVKLTDENIKSAMELGVKRFVTKPFKYKEVSMILNSQ